MNSLISGILASVSHRETGLFSGFASTIEHLCKNRKEEQAAGEDEKNENGNELGDGSEVTPDLPPFRGGPRLAGISTLHEKAHEPLDCKDVGQDEVLLTG